MGDELEELAARGERAKASDEAERDREANRDARRERSTRDRLFERSIESPKGWLVLLAAVAVLAVPGVVIGLRTSDAIVLWIIYGVVCLLLLYALSLVMRSYSLQAFERWLASMPWKFDPTRYKADLRKKRNSGTVVVEVRFAGEVPDVDRKLIENAAIGAGAGEAKLEGDRLTIRSQRIDAYFDGENSSEHSNHKLHRWTLRCVDRGLLAIHKRHAIESIEVSI
jgi:hypothetical protein